MELTYSREQNTLNKIISKHIPVGNNIITDNWMVYSFLNSENSGYRHNICNHSQGSFGRGNLSSSYIESVWGELKQIIKKCIIVYTLKTLYFFTRTSVYY